MKKKEIIKEIRNIIDNSNSTKEAFEKLVELDNKIFDKSKPQASELSSDAEKSGGVVDKLYRSGKGLFKDRSEIIED